MLKIKDNIDLKELKKYGFENHWHRLRKYVLWEGGITKLWIDNHNYLHINSPTIETIDLIYKMHDLFELEEGKIGIKMLTRPYLLEENKKLKEEVKQLEYKLNKKNMNISYVKTNNVNYYEIKKEIENE